MQSRSITALSDIPSGRMPVRSASCMEERILRALRKVAKLIEDDEAYLPIFLRLESELVKVRERSLALKRVQQYSRL